MMRCEHNDYEQPLIALREDFKGKEIDRFVDYKRSQPQNEKILASEILEEWLCMWEVPHSISYQFMLEFYYFCHEFKKIFDKPDEEPVLGVERTKDLLWEFMVVYDAFLPHFRDEDVDDGVTATKIAFEIKPGDIVSAKQRAYSIKASDEGDKFLNLFGYGAAELLDEMIKEGCQYSAISAAGASKVKLVKKNERGLQEAQRILKDFNRYVKSCPRHALWKHLQEEAESPVPKRVRRE
tara:strand:+ start:98 stop:811 length:714 start_codon:yes stop_codon:yes gene_type:complete